MPEGGGDDHAEEPPLVLQNMSAVSRQAAGTTAKKKQGRWGWKGGWGWGNSASVANEPSAPASAPAKSTIPAASSGDLGSSVGPSIAQSPPIEQSTSKTSNATQMIPPGPSSPDSKHSNSSISNKGQLREIDKEEEFLLEMQEKRKDDNSTGDTYAWFEEDLLQRKDQLNEDEVYALDLLERRRDGEELNEEELADLDMISQDRQDALDDEQELGELLDRKDDGEDIDEDRLYHLELSMRRRNGEDLTEDEEEDLKVFDDERAEMLADVAELNELLDIKEDGGEVDEDRLYELELFERKRLGEELSAEEIRDVDFFQRRRLDSKLDIEEHQEMLDAIKAGEAIDEERFYILDLIDKRRNNVELSDVELEDLEAYENARNQEHLDKIEFKALLEAKENGEEVDENRLHILEILGKQRQGKSLSGQDEEDLERYDWERDQVELDEEELDQLQNQKRQGGEFNEDRLRLLELLKKKRDSDKISLDEQEELALFTNQRWTDYRNERELTELLGKQDAGEEVDEDRIYELQLREKERLGEPMTNEEIDDLELFEKAESGPISDESKINTPKDAKALDEVDRTLDNTNLAAQSLKGVQDLHHELGQNGMPSTIDFQDPDCLETSSRVSLISHSDESYIQDLLAQKDRREEDRREETLQDALELYQIALKEKNMKESEKMFTMIFNQLLKERNEEAKVEDQKQDEFIRRELEQAEKRKNDGQEGPFPAEIKEAATSAASKKAIQNEHTSHLTLASNSEEKLSNIVEEGSTGNVAAVEVEGADLSKHTSHSVALAGEPPGSGVFISTEEDIGIIDHGNLPNVDVEKRALVSIPTMERDSRDDSNSQGVTTNKFPEANIASHEDSEETEAPKPKGGAIEEMENEDQGSPTSTSEMIETKQRVMDEMVVCLKKEEATILQVDNEGDLARSTAESVHEMAHLDETATSELHRVIDEEKTAIVAGETAVADLMKMSETEGFAVEAAQEAKTVAQSSIDEEKAAILLAEQEIHRKEQEAKNLLQEMDADSTFVTELIENSEKQAKEELMVAIRKAEAENKLALQAFRMAQEAIEQAAKEESIQVALAERTSQLVQEAEAEESQYSAVQKDITTTQETSEVEECLCRVAMDSEARALESIQQEEIAAQSASKAEVEMQKEQVETESEVSVGHNGGKDMAAHLIIEDRLQDTNDFGGASLSGSLSSVNDKVHASEELHVLESLGPQHQGEVLAAEEKEELELLSNVQNRAATENPSEIGDAFIDDEFCDDQHPSNSYDSNEKDDKAEQNLVQELRGTPSFEANDAVDTNTTGTVDEFESRIPNPDISGYGGENDNEGEVEETDSMGSNKKEIMEVSEVALLQDADRVVTTNKNDAKAMNVAHEAIIASHHSDELHSAVKLDDIEPSTPSNSANDVGLKQNLGATSLSSTSDKLSSNVEKRLSELRNADGTTASTVETDACTTGDGDVKSEPAMMHDWEDLEYEELLLGKFRSGGTLDVSELFELKAFSKRRQGVILSMADQEELARLKGMREIRQIEIEKDRKELEALRAMKEAGGVIDEDALHELELFDTDRQGRPLSEDEGELLHLLSRRRSSETLDSDDVNRIEFLLEKTRRDRKFAEELNTLQQLVAENKKVDEERLYELKLRKKRRDGLEMTSAEVHELQLFDKLDTGGSLTDAEMKDLHSFKSQRLDVMFARDLGELRDRQNEGIDVDPRKMFQLELFERRLQEEELTLDELRLIGLLEAEHLGNKLSQDDEKVLAVLMDQLGPQAKDQIYILDEEDREYRRELAVRKQRNKCLDGDETFELDILNRADDGDLFVETELNVFEDLRMRKAERRREKEDLLRLREECDSGIEGDKAALYELELFEKHRNRAEMTNDEEFEVSVFRKRRAGVDLSEHEEAALRALLGKREAAAQDKKELHDLLMKKDLGEEYDVNLLYELQLFDRHRSKQELNENELFELDLLEKRRGGLLTEDEVKTLEALVRERESIALEAEEIRAIKAKRENGELIDGDKLYELELFHRRRIGEDLDKDDLTEIELFERRRAGIDLSEDDLDILVSLKQKRLREATSIEEDDIVEDDDSMYIRSQRKRLQRGERLHRDELAELELLERQKKGDGLGDEEIAELELLRQERKKLHESTKFPSHQSDTEDRSLIKTQLSKKAKKQKKEKKAKTPKEKKVKQKKPKEKRMRRKRKPPKSEDSTKEMKQLDEAKSQLEEATEPAVEPPVNPPHLPPPPPKGPPPKQEKRLFGGLFGRKSKKELELEEARRRQEELIKEQLKAMQMEEELKEMEKEKEQQEQMIQEALENKSRVDEASVSSWETDTSYEKSDVDSEDEESSVSSSESSGSYESSDSESSGGSLRDSHDIGENKTEIKSADSEAEKKGKVTEDEVSTQRSPKSHERPDPEITSKPISVKDTSSKPSSLPQRASQPNEKVDALPLKEIGATKDGVSHRDLEVMSALSGDSSMASVAAEPAKIEKKSTTKSDSSEKKEAEPARVKAKTAAPLEEAVNTISLSEHLRRKRKERKNKKSGNDVGTYGDDISLGSLGKKEGFEKTTAVQESSKAKVKLDFEGGTESVNAARPWQSSIPSRKIKLFGPMGDSDPTSEDVEEKSDFFEENQHVFDRSVFNFDQDIAGREEEDSVSKEDELSVVMEGESEESEGEDEETKDEAKEDNEAVDSIATIGFEAEQSFTVLNYGGIESKLDGKMRDREEEFNEAWETIEADEAVAAQMNQRRMLRLRDRPTNREKKDEEEDQLEVPRLFVFEGEKFDNQKRSKKKRKKDRKKQKKLDHKLSKEFRRAMREVFDYESEEEYDRFFGEDKEDMQEPGVMPRRNSNASMYDSDGQSHHSNPSEGEGSEEFDDDYLKRLREKSMQQDVKELLYDKKYEEEEDGSDSESQASEVSRSRPTLQRRDSGASNQSKQNSGRRRKGKTRRNKSGEVVGDDIDPADVYSQEVAKGKNRKTFTISDLRKEMEEMHQIPAAGSFKNAFDQVNSNTSAFPKSTSNFAQNTASFNTPMKSKNTFKPKSRTTLADGPGLDSLQAMNSRPEIGSRQQSFATNVSDEGDLGLLGGGRKPYDNRRKSAFDIGGNLAAIPTIAEDEEEAFLNSQDDNSTRTGRSGRSHPRPSSRFSAAIASFASPRSFGGTSQNGGKGKSGKVGGGLGGTGFQEPLPLPEMQEEENGSKRKLLNVVMLAGKMKRLIGRKREATSNFGDMLNDEAEAEMQGGLLG